MSKRICLLALMGALVAGAVEAHDCRIARVAFSVRKGRPSEEWPGGYYRIRATYLNPAGAALMTVRCPDQAGPTWEMDETLFAQVDWSTFRLDGYLGHDMVFDASTITPGRYFVAASTWQHWWNRRYQGEPEDEFAAEPYVVRRGEKTITLR
jgi:hypothetical protein